MCLCLLKLFFFFSVLKFSVLVCAFDDAFLPLVDVVSAWAEGEELRGLHARVIRHLIFDDDDDDM